ncbi:hypothetical protein [Dehalogenimonas sp. 4OHTPN]|uniref:Uncharacterized protein n=1 Tax=Dehalogenimonas sp. 4OHTPN TaxID=3166643 RepID=A0AAU8GBT7_9CHLR
MNDSHPVKSIATAVSERRSQPASELQAYSNFTLTLPVAGGFQIPLPGIDSNTLAQAEIERADEWHYYLGSR